MRPESVNSHRWSRKVSGADSFFLSIESDDCPINMGLLLLLEAGDEPMLLARIREVVSGSATQSRKLRCRLEPAPLNLDHPRWVPDPDFDLNTHIIRHDLTGADEPGALQHLIEKIASARLPLDKPLWQVHIIEQATRDNQTALILKMHHSFADGITGMQLLQELMDHNASRRKTAPPATAAHAYNDSREALIHYRYQRWLRFPFQILRALLTDTALYLYFSYRFLLGSRLRSAASAAPPTRFNRPISARRSYAYGNFQLKELREIYTAYSCSRNEAFLAVVAGSLRAYLSERQELPPKSLYAGLPLTLFETDQRSQADNQLAFYRSSLATRTGDPEQRLKKIQQRLARSTERVRSEWRKRLLERLLHVPPRTAQKITRLYRLLLRRRLLAPNFNLFTTLLPGSIRKVSICNRQVTGIYPISIPYHGVGIAITAIRYHDQLQFGIIADREQLPDPDHLAELMRDTGRELLTRARRKNRLPGSAS